MGIAKFVARQTVLVELSGSEKEKPRVWATFKDERQQVRDKREQELRVNRIYCKCAWNCQRPNLINKGNTGLVLTSTVGLEISPLCLLYGLQVTELFGT